MTANGTSNAPVAIVTGGASGMGLSVVEELISREWQVLVLDLNAEAGQGLQERLGDRLSFTKTDVTDYEQLSKAFVQTWKKFNRLDFVFANAGIGDLQNFYTPVEEREDGSPAKPNTVVLDVCLMHVVYAAWLSLHYFRKNSDKKGKFVSTSSMCGLYPGEGIPLYTAAKHGVVGLTRALSRRLIALGEPVTINCICPGLVDTGLTKNTLMPFASPEIVTPHSTIVKAVMSFIDDESKNGLAAECSVDRIHYRTQQDFGDENAAKLMTASFEKTVKERMAREGEERPDSAIGSS